MSSKTCNNSFKFTCLNSVYNIMYLPLLWSKYYIWNIPSNSYNKSINCVTCNKTCPTIQVENYISSNFTFVLLRECVFLLTITRSFPARCQLIGWYFVTLCYVSTIFYLSIHLMHLGFQITRLQAMPLLMPPKSWIIALVVIE